MFKKGAKKIELFIKKDSYPLLETSIPKRETLK
jgi:hypothetical protein